MKIIKVKNYEELSLKASEIMVELLKAKPDATLGLATGSSPIGLYKNLIKAYNNKEISFEDVKTYNLDEYCELPREHAESYYTFMHKNLFDHVNIKEENIHIPSSVGSDLQKNCDDYNNLLNSATVDVQLLGIGGNGHIGFNEPGTSFESETQIIKLADKTREDNKRFFNSIDEVPTHAITMGIKNILNAKSILLVASGKNKAEAIYKLVNEGVTEDFPASALKNHKNVTVIVDSDAASLL
ncbi:MAG: glucosamine-6-phosphate deaminase [Bacilli bacterium]